jgi:gamma-glutamylcyclotransferase (GGCT)/AIG2-like uncharacterized protein YtfP
MDADAARRVKIFVYGTLLRGEAAHGLLGDARFVGAAHTEPSFTLLDLGEYPALVAGGRDRVAGEIYEIDAARLAALDAYEDCPAMYARRDLQLGDQRALAYVLQPGLVLAGTRIASGSWRER